MLREKLRDLFKNYDTEIQQLVWEAGEFEQMNISMKAPRFSEEYDAMITRIARKLMEQDDSDVFEDWLS